VLTMDISLSSKTFVIHWS